MRKAYLVLSSGDVFEGVGFGYEGEALGELVFTTGMCGYIETLTDPSYYGQIVMQTFPLIGNYGMIEEDFEGGCFVKGYVARSFCDTPSNFRSGGTLDSYLKKNKIPAVCGIDTREVTRIIRESGVMNAVICKELPADTEQLKRYRIIDAVSSVSRKEKETFLALGKEKFKVALVDYGAKQNIIRSLQQRGCRVTVFPHNVKAEELYGFDGVMLSNGPGDPQENKYEIAQIQKLLGKVPVFGICLGHQLLALASGGTTVKLKYGHRGVNQPVKEVQGSRTYITSQNHGYAVVSQSLAGKGEISFLNANDGTCEGIDYPKWKAFSVQFHPEACAGPKDTAFLFDKFTALMEKKECRLIKK